jgi:tRNA pseudouridine(38-40) synthase
MKGEEVIQEVQKEATCEVCHEIFPSKTRLFRHLVESHGLETPTKAMKVVVLIGWLSCTFTDVDQWINDKQATADPIDVTSSTVELSVFEALNKLENRSGNNERPRGYSRGSSVQQRTTLLFAQEPTCHSFSDTFCFQVSSWNNPGGKQGWIVEMNKLLPYHIRVLHAYAVSGSAGSNFHAEMDCSQRRYEYLIPLKMIMPLEFVKPPEMEITRRNHHRVVDDSFLKSVKTDSSLMDKNHPLETVEGQTRVAFFRRLKSILQLLTGKRRYHNFVTSGAEPSDNNVYRKVDRIFHKELIRVKGEGEVEDDWVIFSVSGDTFLRGQIRKMLGLAVAVALDFLPVSFIESAFDERYSMNLPALPGFPLYLAECKYSFWEAKYTEYRLDPRRTETGMTKEMKEWDSVLRTHIISQCQNLFHSEWVKEFKNHCSILFSRYEIVSSKLNRDLEQVFEEKFKFQYSLEDRNDSPFPFSEVKSDGCYELSNVDDHRRLDCEICDKCVVKSETVNARRGNVDEFVERITQLKFLKVPSGNDDVPSVYLEVLTLLRQADRSMAWPASSSGRQSVIEDETLLEFGGRGGSFSVGAFPGNLIQPKGNLYFPGELYFPFNSWISFVYRRTHDGLF